MAFEKPQLDAILRIAEAMEKISDRLTRISELLDPQKINERLENEKWAEMRPKFDAISTELINAMRKFAVNNREKTAVGTLGSVVWNAAKIKWFINEEEGEPSLKSLGIDDVATYDFGLLVPSSKKVTLECLRIIQARMRDAT